MHLQPPEARPERRLLRRGEHLVTKEQHLMLGERRFERVDDFVVEVAAEVDPDDLGPERAGDPADVEHGTHAANSAGGRAMIEGEGRAGQALSARPGAAVRRG